MSEQNPSGKSARTNAGSINGAPINGESAKRRPAVSFVSGGDRHIRSRLMLSRVFAWLCRFSTYAALAVLVVLLAAIFYSSIGRLSPDFVTNTNSTSPLKAGILAGLWGSFWLILFTAMFSVPVGVGSAVYLEEIAKDSMLVRIIKVNLANLAGVPSIVYGILGYTVFRTSAAAIAALFDGKHVIGVLGLFKVRLSKLPIYEDNILVGALTLTLVILPTVIAASQEALRSVPGSIRVASLALGATRWQTIWRQVIPAALPGISTGVILSTSRAIGEAAPLIMLGALTYTSMCPGGIESPLELLTKPTQLLHAPLDQFTAMPIEIYDWSKQPDARFTAVAASGIVVLLVVLLSINSVAMVVRHFASRRLKW
jgi:phosphate transport system permease protein